MNLRLMFLAALLLACEDTHGQLGKSCNPDGTCDSASLECVNAPELLGIPLREAVCNLALDYSPTRRTNNRPGPIDWPH